MTVKSATQQHMLLVDDEPGILTEVSLLLASSDIKHVATISDSRKVVQYVRENRVSAVILDWVMPNVTGGEILQCLSTEHPQIPVIVMTAMGDVETAVGCMRQGAFDFLTKPVDPNRLVASVKKALQVSELGQQNRILKDYLLADLLGNPDAFAGIVTTSKKMRGIFQYIEAIATSRLPVLITGETGAGKELLARAVHDVSGVCGPFISLNAAGLDDFMFSVTLFGHKKGAFTGADSKREGLIAAAAGGTLFLDEIGDLSESSQVKLLRLIEDRKYYPLGADVPRESDARIVCATHRSLETLLSKGRFRRDLYYRLSGHKVHLFPLRERKEDIPLLVDAFLAEAAEAEGKRKPTPPAELCTLLSTYDFPGNVRELRMMVFDAVLRHNGGVLSLESFRKAVGTSDAPPAGEGSADAEAPEGPPSLFGGVSRLPTLKEAVDQLVAEALARARDNQGIAASLLGITRQALNKRLVRGGRGDVGGAGQGV